MWDSRNKTALIPRKWLSCNIVTTPFLRSPRAQSGTSKQRPVFSSAPIIGCRQGSGTLLRETHCAHAGQTNSTLTHISQMGNFRTNEEIRSPKPGILGLDRAVPTTDKIKAPCPRFSATARHYLIPCNDATVPLSFSGFRRRSKCSQAGYRRQWGLEAYGRSLAHLDEMLPDQLDLRSMGRVPVLHGEAVVVVHELLWCC